MDTPKRRAPAEGVADTTPARHDKEEESLATPGDGHGAPDKARSLKVLRGRKSAVFTRACNTAEAQLSQRVSGEELEKRLTSLNEALDGVLAASYAYADSLEDPDEMQEAEEYVSRLTTRHSQLVDRIRRALADQAARSTTGGSHRGESQASQRVGRAGSQVSGASNASRASKEAEIDAELKALELKQLKARQARERRVRSQKAKDEERVRSQKAEDEERVRIQKAEDEGRVRSQKAEEEERVRIQKAEEEERQELREVQNREDDLERAVVKARLYKAAEDEMAWDRRNDFYGEAERDVHHQSTHHAPAAGNRTPSVADEAEPQSTRRDQPSEARIVRTPATDPRLATSPARHAEDDRPPHNTGRARELGTATTLAMRPSSEPVRESYDPASWLMEPQLNYPRTGGTSAFVKSIPRLSLPVFSGEPQEWPRWIGLFKALVHDQPSLTESERMAHLQNAVEGPAAQAIEGMLYNGALYHEALKTLHQRFGREEDIIQAHLRKVFDTPPPTLTDLPSMETFYAVLHNAVTVLRNLGYVGDLASSENLRRVVQKLPSELSREWGKEVFSTRPARPTLETFCEWLQVQVSVLSFASLQAGPPEKKRSSHAIKETAARKAALSTGAKHGKGNGGSQKPSICVFCDEDHPVVDCPAAKSLSVEARMKKVREEGRCFSCLNKGHWIQACRSSKRCTVDGCKGSHHRLLHVDRTSPAASEATPLVNEPQQRSLIATSLRTQTDTLLQIVKVRVHGTKGTKDVLALLDNGAQTSLCREEVLQDLGIKGERRQLCIQTVEDDSAEKPSQRVRLTISGLGAGAKKGRITVEEAWSVTSLNINVTTIARDQIQAYQHLQGLEFPQYSGGKVELLLGANVLEGVLQKEVRVGRQNEPVAVRTDLGWTLTGSAAALVPSAMRQIMFLRKHRAEQDEQLSTMVANWWSTEAFGTRYRGSTTRSQEDEKALNMLQSTTKQTEGRYEARLLWREEKPTFPDNRRHALKRLEGTEKKLKRQPEVGEKYRDVLSSYIADGHARKLTAREVAVPTDRRWLLPHHAVISANKPGKVRVVFDAAAVHCGVSLNDKLLTGPDMLQSLPGVLLRFREEPIAIAADITQMYHQIKIAEEDQPATSFLWRDLDQDKPPDTYQMQVAIFGARSSPAIASYVLRLALEDHWGKGVVDSQKNPKDVQRSFYMDDFLHSEKDVAAAKQMKGETTRALSKGGFQLTKWRSNRKEVLEDTSVEERATPQSTLCVGASPDAIEKALGVVWDEHHDTLGFRLREADEPLTKRGVLSRAASVFDPLGMVSPFTLQARIMMQRLWTKQLTWDELLPEPELTSWQEWLRESRGLSSISVPRCVVPEVEVLSRQLHVFCDASEDAFGAVIYMRSTTHDGEHHCQFLIAKNRVAPLKRLSIVRLELQAALLGARLADTVITELATKPDEVFYWSDSCVILQYLANESRRFQAFVANRVAEVKEMTAGRIWRHVPGKLNPADDCSRGLTASDLTPQSRWLAGPAFLLEDQEVWPPVSTPPSLTTETEGVKPTVLVSMASTSSQMLPSPDRFSSWLTYRRVVAWMRRFSYNTRNKPLRSGLLTTEELKESEVGILKQTQAEFYPEETRRLPQGQDLPTGSQLLPLSPYCDSDGLLRVGGRLENAPAPVSARHPVILPRRGQVARLIVMHHHVKHGHAGVEHTLNEIRQEYWIVKGRAAVKKLLHDCAVCRRVRAHPCQPRMASLPPARFDATKAFSSTGIDIFGPLAVKRFRRTEKRYGLLATCMATRAIHLEVVHSLDTDSCIMALRRLFARRGRPAALYSDNGTNFVGSNRELRAELRAMEKELGKKLGAFEVQWHFNPPAASHMGGVWERMVRSVKKALHIVVGRQTLTDEVLQTVFAEVEHMVNSRPLTYVSSDPTDPEALTPNHFLLGHASPHLAPGLVRDRDLCSRRRWKQTQAVSEGVWKRWVGEYLPTLIQRTKWRRQGRQLQVGDLVLMADSNTSRGSWPLARITRVFPGADGVVRSAELRTAGGRHYTRPATKICFLEEDCA